LTVGTNIAASVPWVGASLRELLIGGRNIDQPTLLRFYVLHVVFLPAALGLLLAYHMWRVRKDGGLARADRVAMLRETAPEEPVRTKTYTLLGVARGTAPTIRASSLEARDLTVNSVPDLVRRAAVAVLGTFAVVSVLASLVRSPLEEPANPLVTPNPAKAPWYFLWLQEIVTDTTFTVAGFTVNGAFLGGVILPGLLVGLLVAWPWLDRSGADAAGVWLPASRRWQNRVFLLVVLLVVALTIVGTFLRGPSWQFFWPWQPWPELPTRI
jgi:quinol-cytochrome oxidoreductase complex cytochrome b subunit